MNGLAQCLHLRHQRQRDSDEPFHVAAAPTVPTISTPVERKGIVAPILSIDGHHIGMTGQHDSTRYFRPDRRNKIGLSPIGAGNTP